MLEPEKYVRKSFDVDAVRVTEANLEAVAEWSGGEVRSDNHGKYIKVRVNLPRNERQTKAYVGDWVLYAGAGFKVYMNKAFQGAFKKPFDGPPSGATDPSQPFRVAPSGGQAEGTIAPVQGPVVVDRGTPRPKPGPVKKAVKKP